MRESTLELAKSVLINPRADLIATQLAYALLDDHREEVEQQRKINELQRELEKIMCLNTIEDTLVNEWDKGGK